MKRTAREEYILTLFGLGDHELHGVNAERADGRGVELDERADTLQLLPLSAPVRPDVQTLRRMRRSVGGAEGMLEVVGETRRPPVDHAAEYHRANADGMAMRYLLD